MRVKEFFNGLLVLHPERNRTHFHLLYGTRHPDGLEVFKKVEERAMEAMEKARGEARRRKRHAKSRQMEMFGAAEMHDPAYYERLRDQYLSAAKWHLEQCLRARGAVPYESAWEIALTFPLVWERDLKGWVSEWKNNGKLIVEGLAPSKRVPKRDEGHRLLWKENTR